MKMICVTFRSITPAQRSQRVLQGRGIPSSLQRTPRWMQDRGCGYCLRLRPEQLELALPLLKESGIAYQKIYLEEDGLARELTV